jgi:threonine aldolase
VLARFATTCTRSRFHALSLTQASEYGRSYRAAELAALTALARERGLKIHMDGARFANAVAFLGCAPADACGDIDALSFGCVKNGAMNAEAIVFFDPALADVARYRRKRAGHCSRRAATSPRKCWRCSMAVCGCQRARRQRRPRPRSRRRGRPAAASRSKPTRCSCAAPRPSDAALRAQGFGFYDWGPRRRALRRRWDTKEEHARSLARAIAGL